MKEMVQKMFSKKGEAPKEDIKTPEKTGRPPQKKQFTPKHTQKGPNGDLLKTYVIGGLNEIGKNCMAFEYGGDIMVIDIGLAFPDEDMLGVDFVIPDTTFLEQNKNRIRGIVITHAHLDHIGALQHVLPKIGFPPMYMTKLTAGLVQKRLEEYGIWKKCLVHIIDPEKDKVKIGRFDVEFFPQNHSIPDCMGVFCKTPAGTFVHTGDFKFDFTPTDGKPSNLQRMAEIGKEGVDILFCESTNAMKPGYCLSESVVVKNLEHVIEKAKGRIILASFSSLVSRLEQIVRFAHKNGRKVFISGRSMQNTMEIAAKNGYFKVPKGSIRRIGPAASDLPDKEVLIVTTGSQGEPHSALTRIGHNTHPQISIKKGDSVVFSSSPIPGNERSVFSSINNLVKMGAEVITNSTLDIHASGHAFADDLKLMHRLMTPKCLVPVHGELFMREKHKKLALDVGFQEEQISLLENGSILEYDRNKKIFRKSKSKIPSEIVMVDGLGAGDTGTRVIEERKMMASGGMITVVIKAMQKSQRIVGDPMIVSRGFIYMKESKDILNAIRTKAKKSYEDFIEKNPDAKIPDIQRALKRGVQSLVYKKIQREPMIIPVIISV